MGKLFFKALSLLCAVSILVIPFDTSAYYSNEYDEIRAICSAISGAYKKSDDTLRILSYNVLSDGIGFEGAPSSQRQDGLICTLTALSPDILCLQEVSRGWLTIIKNNTPFTSVEGIKTEIAGLMTTIFYDEETVELKEWGNEVYNTGGDYRMRRAVWGLFEIKSTGKLVCVVSTHFNITKATDTYSSAQAMELLSIVEGLSNKFTCPIFVAGDFNAKKRTSVTYPSSSIYEMLSAHLTDTDRIAEMISTCDKGTKPSSTVDHIFLKGKAEIKRYVVLSNKEFLNISDHYPIFIDVEM